MKTIVGLFDSFDDARTVVDELVHAGMDRTSIRLDNESKGESAFSTSKSEAYSSDLLMNGLTGMGVPRNDAMIFAEGVRRGGSLVVLSAPDDRATRAYEILSQHGSVDLDERMKHWTKSGWTGFNETATTGQQVRATELQQGEARLPVIEEELKIGKREVQKGGIRAYSHVVERPVTETVSLHEEHVNVERRKVDRPLTDADRNAFKDTTIEVRERAEEAVVSKQRRVIEEVIITKEAGQRTETINDTLRRTEVKVENLPGQTTQTSGVMQTDVVRFEDFDTDFRTHYKSNFSNLGGAYDDYMPVYRFGHRLGTDERYSTREWSQLEPEARKHWEERNPGTWEQFKDSVRYAWDRVRTRR